MSWVFDASGVAYCTGGAGLYQAGEVSQVVAVMGNLRPVRRRLGRIQGGGANWPVVDAGDDGYVEICVTGQCNHGGHSGRVARRDVRRAKRRASRRRR